MSRIERNKPSKSLSPVSIQLQQIRDALIFVMIEGKEDKRNVGKLVTDLQDGVEVPRHQQRIHD
jgi:hypothetical protein